LPLAALSGASAAVRWRTPFRLPPLPPDSKQILDDRYNRKSLIIASKLPVSGWLALLRNELIAGASNCIDMLRKAILRHSVPEIINSEQGCQFTCMDWAKECAQHHDMKVSMDGKGGCKDNI